MSDVSLTPGQIWAQVTNLIKQRVIQPTLWRAMEAAVPIVIDEGDLVIGFPPGTNHLSGHLGTSENKNAIDRALREVAAEPLKIHVIDGTTLQDWHAAKAQEEEKRRLSESAFARQRQQSQQEKGWEMLMETVQRRFAALQNRQFPQTKAHYLAEVLPLLVDTSIKLQDPRPEVNEINQRQLARIIDRVGTLAELPPTYIAIEYERLRRAKS